MQHFFSYNDVEDIMNRKELFEKLKKELKLDDEMVKKIGNIFDNNFIIGKNNKEKIIDELINKVNVDKKTANTIYNKFVSVVESGIKNKMLGILKKK